MLLDFCPSAKSQSNPTPLRLGLTTLQKKFEGQLCGIKEGVNLCNQNN